MTKKCNKCNEIKPLSEFHKKKAIKSGISGICKQCGREYKAKWQKDNADKTRIYSSNNRKRSRSNWLKTQDKYIHKIPSGIYGILNIKTNEWLYIGSSTAPMRRRSKHLSKGIGTKYNKSPVYHLLCKGLLKREDLEFVILENVDESQLLVTERKWIAQLNPKLNKNSK